MTVKKENTYNSDKNSEWNTATENEDIILLPFSCFVWEILCIFPRSAVLHSGKDGISLVEDLQYALE